MLRCNQVKKCAKHFGKLLKNQISLLNVIEYLDSIGYTVVFYNTPTGDELIKAYGLEAVAEGKKAFTCYEEKAVKAVFVDESLHNSDKLYLLLHEIGHILLKHIGKGYIEHLNKYLAEIEADAFAYDVLIHSKAYCMI